MCITMQKLVEKYMPLANKLAYQKLKQMPKFIDIEDLRSAAYLGLVEAASRFDPKMGIAFSTFAYPRIFGAIQDFLREQRNQGWMTRGDRSQLASLDSTATDEACPLKDTIEARPQDDTEDCFDVISIGLEPQAKEVLRHYFIDDLSMKEVGAKFKVSESRISQLVKQYKASIRANWTREELYAELAA